MSQLYAWLCHGYLILAVGMYELHLLGIKNMSYKEFKQQYLKKVNENHSKLYTFITHVTVYIQNSIQIFFHH